MPLVKLDADSSQPLADDVLSAIEFTWAPASKQFPMLSMGKQVKTEDSHSYSIYDHGILLPVELFEHDFERNSINYQVQLVLTIMGSSEVR